MLPPVLKEGVEGPVAGAEGPVAGADLRASPGDTLAMAVAALQVVLPGFLVLAAAAFVSMSIIGLWLFRGA